MEFIARIEKISEENIAMTILENIYTSEYVLNYDELLKQSDGSLVEFLTSNGIAQGFAEYIETSFNSGMISQLSLSEKILSLVQQFENSLVEA